MLGLKKIAGAGVLRLSLLAAFGIVTGCNDFLNPGEPYIVDVAKTPLVQPILDAVAPGIEPSDTTFSNATDITPEDLIPEIADYQIGKEDVLEVTAYDLNGPGSGATPKIVTVTETGSISLDLIPPVQAEGLTAAQLEKAIGQAYVDAKILVNPRISVTVQQARARTFSVEGNAGNEGEFQITRPDYRMLDAMTAAHAPTQVLGAEYAFVIRKPHPKVTQQPATPGAPSSPSDMLSPQPNAATRSSSDLLAPGSDEGTTGVIAGQTGATAPPANGGQKPFAFNTPTPISEMRVIRVPINRLKNFGELQYDIVIRPGDMIIFPAPVQGVYYMGGHVQGTGAYSLAGSKVTLKAAWTAAHGADDFAILNRTELIRRTGPNQEVTVRLDYSKIWQGLEPDIYLKPDDIVYIGTDLPAPFLATVRNSFRLTYGFGFLYDRNFFGGQLF